MSDSFIQLPADSTGKKVDTETLTVSAQTVHRERHQVAGATDVAIAVVTNTTPGASDYALVTRAAGVTPVSDNGGTLSVDDGGGTLTVDGSVSIGAAIPAGTNNIGDVDVLTTPDQKTEDSAHSTGAIGSFILAVRNDNAAATLTSTDGDYSPIAVDENGRVGITAMGDAIPVSDGGSTISVDDGGGAITVDGSISVTGALPAGDNNIGNIDIASALPAGANKVGSVNPEVSPADGGTVKTVTFAEIDAASSGDNSIVAAQGAGNAILVLSVVLVASGGANTAEWRSATTPISGAMSLAENGGYALESPYGVLKTADNEALQLNLSAATSVDGHLSYVVV